MHWTKFRVSTRKVILCVAVLCLAAIALIAGARMNSTAAGANTAQAVVNIPEATFPADAPSLGAIPEATACGPTPGTPRNVTFTVSGISGSVTNVAVSATFGSPNHTWMGDIIATLIAPNGASHTLFGVTGSTTATGIGDSSDLGATYVFSDTAPAPPSGGWWQQATVQTAAGVMSAGTYRTTASGGAGQTNPAPPTNMNAAFAGVTNANGTWTLRLTDGCTGDTGAITAAVLTVDGGIVPVTGDGPVDFNGDGKTDYVVVRNVGGGPGGQIRWFYNLNGTATTTAKDWGISSDYFISGNWDTDANDDIAVWRSGPAGTAAFYVLKSTDNTAIVEPFGQTGDEPAVVGDYNNDGKTDFAVYRGGANPGDQSTWFYRTTAGGPVFYVPWGSNGDFPAPGDYDNDGNNDFVVQRSNGAGQANFWRNLTTAPDDVITFGTITDNIVPGDYDGDGKTDIAVARPSGGVWTWYYEPSGTAGVTVEQFVFGNSATDFLAQGDYDGDGKTDAGIWRPSLTPGASAFWSRSTQSGAVSSVPFGQNGDYPVANFNSF